MSGLSPRLRQVAEGIRDGKSYTEIGNSLGISKQAAHKLAGAAITTLRENLASMGFQGLDTFLLGRMADCHLCVPADPQVPATISYSKPARRWRPCATSAV